MGWVVGGGLEGFLRGGQWQFGKVIWAELLACGEVPQPPCSSDITPPLPQQPPLSFCLSLSSISPAMFSSPPLRCCVYTVVSISWACLSLALLSAGPHISHGDRIDWMLKSGGLLYLLTRNIQYVECTVIQNGHITGIINQPDYNLNHQMSTSVIR